MVQPISVTLPAFGSVVPGQGGILVAIMRGPMVDGVEQPPYALLMASTSSEFKSPWLKDSRSTLAGALSRTDGWANTQDMLAAECPPAVRLHESTIDGHDDWYVPSIGEIRAARANVVELFGSRNYWTSTQTSHKPAVTARTLEFSMRYSGGRTRGSEMRTGPSFVRPVRRIPLDLLTPGISFTLPPFGTPIPEQGGNLAAILRGPKVDGVEQEPYALLISSGIDKEFRRAWGTKVEIPGAESYTDGLANTQDMLAAQCPAALCLREAPIDGHGDWYLPSLSELMAAVTNVPEMLEKSNRYYSSTQNGFEQALIYHSDQYGDMEFFDYKPSALRVRPFRRIPLQLLTS